jgi:hypothetical protein
VSSEERDGFEWKNEFYRWSVSDIGKDLMLIDRIAQMPASEFIDMMGEIGENERAPILLGLIATSIRAGHPDWSVDRIYRVVMGLSLSSDIEFISSGGTEDDDDEKEEERGVGPPAVAAGPPSAAPSRSTSNGSSPPSTPQGSSSSPTSSATRA